jgi:hypothetical protein
MMQSGMALVYLYFLLILIRINDMFCKSYSSSEPFFAKQKKYYSFRGLHGLPAVEAKITPHFGHKCGRWRQGSRGVTVASRTAARIGKCFARYQTNNWGLIP